MKVDPNKGILRNLKERHYIINLQKNRSLVALISCCVSLFLTICCINYGLVQYARNGVKPLDLFQYFTITANAITAFATAMIIPYAIDGFRKKRFYCPKWAVLFYFTGTWPDGVFPESLNIINPKNASPKSHANIKQLNIILVNHLSNKYLLSLSFLKSLVFQK